MPVQFTRLIEEVTKTASTLAIISIYSTFLLYTQPFDNPDTFIAVPALIVLLLRERLEASGQGDGLAI